jgi:uncharacterized protein (TIRG00374 family)
MTAGRPEGSNKTQNGSARVHGCIARPATLPGIVYEYLGKNASYMENPPAPVRRSAAKLITTAAAFVLAGVLLFYSLRGIEWREVGSLIRGADPRFALVCCLLASCGLFLRAYRWRILLSAETPIGIPLAFWATAAGYFGNNFLPARAGEFVRTFMIAGRSRLSKTFVLTTAFTERFADGIALVVITGLVLMVMPGKTPWLANAARGFAGVGIVGVLGIAILPRIENFARGVLERLPVSAGLHVRLAHVLEHGLRGLRAFHDWTRLLGFIGLTIVVWSIDATATVLGSRALHLDPGISYPIAFILIAALGLGSAVPSAPGYVGIYQFISVAVLTPFGFTKTSAIAYIIFFQALNYLVVGLWGSVGFLQYRRMRHEPVVEGVSTLPA